MNNQTELIEGTEELEETGELEETESLEEDFNLLGLRPYVCPECDKQFDTPDLLSPHLERHNRVKPPKFSLRGKPRSKECPRGCGRNFKVIGKGWERVEMHAHVATCDGSEPIPDQPIYVKAGKANPL